MSLNAQNYAVAVAPKLAIAPQTVAGATTTNGTAIDLEAATADMANEVAFDVLVGTIATGAVTAKLQSSPDNSTWTDVPGTTTPSIAASTVFPISIGCTLLGTRYVRVAVTTTGTNAVIAASYTPFQMRQQPANGKVNGTHFIALGD